MKTLKELIVRAESFIYAKSSDNPTKQSIKLLIDLKEFREQETNKKCSNCKYLEGEKWDFRCGNEKIINYFQTHDGEYYANCVNDTDFCCNLWENKI